MLAYCLRSPDLTFKIIKVKPGASSCTPNLVDIVRECRTQLEKLYKGPMGFSVERAEALFSSVSLPAMSPELHNSMERPVEGSEVAFTIKQFKANNNPGPDGFSASFYKKFIDVLSPRLAKAFNAVLEGGTFSPQALQVHVCMLPK